MTISLKEMHQYEKERVRADSEIYKDLMIYRSGDDNRPCVKIWKGDASKPYANYYFKDPESRERFITKEKESADARERRREEKARQRALLKENFENPFEPGGILHHSWGYEQTQCDFYQVVGVKLKSVVLKPIAAQAVPGSEGFMSESRVPVKDGFIETSTALTRHSDRVSEITKKVLAYMNGGDEIVYYIPAPHGWCARWDGKPQYCSWYA